MGKTKDKSAVASKKKNPKEELLVAAGGSAEGDKKGNSSCRSQGCDWDGNGQSNMV